MAKDLKIEITLTGEFMEKTIVKTLKGEKGDIIGFMSLMILRSEKNKIPEGESLQIDGDNIMNKSLSDERGAFLRALSLIVSMGTIDSNALSSGKTIEDIINGEPDEE